MGTSAADTARESGESRARHRASRNIGRAIAHALAAGGAAVAVNTRASQGAADRSCAKSGTSAAPQRSSWRTSPTRARVRAMVDRIVRQWDGSTSRAQRCRAQGDPYLDLSYDEWRMIMGISLDGSFHCTQACIPHMIAAGGGSIVTLAGMMSLSGTRRRIHGSVAKHGMVGLTRGIAREFGEQGIRANRWRRDT